MTHEIDIANRNGARSTVVRGEVRIDADPSTARAIASIYADADRRVYALLGDRRYAEDWESVSGRVKATQRGKTKQDWE